MIKLLLDENVPAAIGDYLRNISFDVVHAKDIGMLGSSDDQIMAAARCEERTLITFDKHFADIALYPPDSHWEVIRIRIHPPTVDKVTETLAYFLKQFDLSSIRGTLIILESNGFRIRRASLT
jgi:predicted nuclease of predicted toxin-antitoxin system